MSLRLSTTTFRTLQRCAIALALVIAWGCADKIVGPHPIVPTGQVGVFADLGTTGVTTLVIQVSGPGIVKPDNSPDTLAFNIPLTNGVASGSVQVPAGPSRVITARAFVGVSETHRGSTTTNILEGNNPTLQITLVPLVGSLPITVSIGSTIVTVRPLLASLAVGDTLRLTAEIRDHNGQVVTGESVRWATLNPLKASVTTGGLVTMLDTGAVQVVATYGTVGGASKITGSSAVSDLAYHLTWNGSVNNNWSEVNNWTPHGIGAARVPTLSDSVVIPAGVSKMPRLDGCVDNNAVRDIVIEEGASLTTSCYPLNVYGSAVVRGAITTVYARPNARLAGVFSDLYIKGDGVRLLDNVSATYVEVNFPTGTFLLNGHTLRTSSDFTVNDGTVTMAAGDSVVIGGNGYWNGDDQTGLLTGGVVVVRGNQFYGYRYYGTGTSRLVLDRTATGQQSIGGFDYVNSPTNSQIRRLVIRSRDGVSICGHLRVTDTLSFESTGTPATMSTCSSYQIRALGPVITSANTDVANYYWDLRHPTGTSLVAGTWHPQVTEFAVDNAAMNPALSYGSITFSARNTLPASMAISGGLTVTGAATELDLNGKKLQVAGALETRNGATLKMVTATDSLIVGEYASFNNDFHVLQKPKLTAGVLTIGGYLYGLGFASAGTRVVMTGTSASNQKYISGVNYESRPAQELQDLEIAADVTYGLCERVRVRDVVVRSGAKLQEWCSGSILSVSHDIVGEPTSTINPATVVINNATGTSNVAGTFSPGQVDFNLVNATVNPALAYQNLRFLASNRLLGPTTATGYVNVNGAGVDLAINGQTLTVGNYLQLDNSATLTMTNAADSVAVAAYVNFSANTSAAQVGKLTAGTLTIGEYLSGFGFSASGTHTVVMTGTRASTNKYIASVNFESRPTQGFQNLQIAANATYGLCERVEVKGTLTVRAGATLQDWCSQPYLRLDGNLVTEAGSMVKPYNVQLNSAYGTQNVGGGFSPTYTSIHASAAAEHLQPELGYQNVQFFAPVTLQTGLTVNGELNVDGPASIFTLGGNNVTVTGDLNLRNNATLVMQNESDLLDVSGNVRWSGGGSEVGKLTHGTTIFRGDDVCVTNYETGPYHTTIFDRSAGLVRFRCHNSSTTSQLLNKVVVQGMGVSLECNMNVANSLEVAPGATLRESCGSGTLYVGNDLRGSEGSAITNGLSYPSTNQLNVLLGGATGTAHIYGAYSPHFTEFMALNAAIQPTWQGSGIDYKHVRIDQSTTFQDTTEIDGNLELINSAIVDLGGHTIVVKGSMDFNNSARLRMVQATDTLVVGYGDPTADLLWDAPTGDNSTDGTNPLLTRGAVKFYGDRFVGTQYKASVPSVLEDQESGHHRFIFMSDVAGTTTIEGGPQFVNLEVRGLRALANNSTLTLVKDSLIMGASTTFGGSNQLQVLGDIVTESASDLSVATIYVDGPRGTSLVGGRFRPTTAYFRSASPASDAIRPGLEYKSGSIQLGQYMLAGSTTFANDLDIVSGGRLTVNGKSLNVGGSLTLNTSGSIVMAGSEELVKVNGNVQFSSNAGPSILSAGTLTVAGNYSMSADIAASGSHTLVLNGSSPQTINALNGSLRALQNLTISGMASVSFSSGVYVSGALRITTPASVTGGSNSEVHGVFQTVSGSSFTHGNLALYDPSGTSLVDGTLNITGTITFATGSQTIRSGSGMNYANLDVKSIATTSGFLTVPGTLTISAGGQLDLEEGGKFGDVNVSGVMNFNSGSTSTGTLTIRGGGLASTARNLDQNVFMDFARIRINTGGSMNNGDRSSGLGGFRYNLAGSPFGFTNDNGGRVGMSGPDPIGH